MDLGTAIYIAAFAHLGQEDLQGQPYILHPLRVMDAVGSRHAAQVVAILHDVLEDTTVSLESLRSSGLSPECEDALVALTYRKGAETREEYMARVKANPLATHVKLKDLYDNLRPGLEGDHSHRSRVARYEKEIAFLLAPQTAEVVP